MTTGREYIDSGILEQYVLGVTSADQSLEVEERAAADPAIRNEIEAIGKAMEFYAMQHAIQPDATIKPFLLATIDYTERLKNGEPAMIPPSLNEHSTIEDYAPWLNRTDMMATGSENIQAKIIGFTAEATTAIVWIKDFAPQEIHDHEIEKFLIVEGTCDIIVGDTVHQLSAGDYFPIPLHKIHQVKVTSAIPCKIILQRMAA
jgi:mannose-6-phosphate isomerase-like protein (cupin superfamily)